MEQVQLHIKELEDSKSSDFEHRPQLQLKKVEVTNQRVTEDTAE